MIVNLERDMSWVISRTFVTAQVAAFSSTAWAVGTDSNVLERANNASSLFLTTTAGTFNAAGCLLLPPSDGDVTPYRVIGEASPGDPSNIVQWWFGFFDTGNVARAFQIGSGPTVDKVIAMPAILAADPDFGKSLCLFGTVRNVVANEASLNISAQRMISKPPQYASAVS